MAGSRSSGERSSGRIIRRILGVDWVAASMKRAVIVFCVCLGALYVFLTVVLGIELHR